MRKIFFKFLKISILWPFTFYSDPALAYCVIAYTYLILQIFLNPTNYTFISTLALETQEKVVQNVYRAKHVRNHSVENVGPSQPRHSRYIQSTDIPSSENFPCPLGIYRHFKQVAGTCSIFFSFPVVVVNLECR